MKAIGMLVLLILNTLVPSDASAETLTMVLPGKIVTVTTQIVGGVQISDSCVKKKEKQPSCQAYRALLKRVSSKKPDVPLAGHPAAFYCGSAGGLNRIVKDSKNNEFDFCEFKDGSMINSWHLYNKSKK